MIPLAWREVEALGSGGSTAERGEVTGIEADSREVGPGDLFVALNAGSGSSATRGRAAPRRSSRTTRRPHWPRSPRSSARRATRGSSPSSARRGRRRRRTSSPPSARRTCPTIWAERSLNNEIGLPLTVCRLEPETRVLVTEMGMRGLGQIAALCAIARPDVVVVPHIGPEHLELLGTVERVAEANAEAIAALPAGGTAVVPGARRRARAVPHARRRLVPPVRSGRGRSAERKHDASASARRASSSSSRSRSATSR